MTAPVFVPDEVVTAAKMNQLPKGVLDYAVKTDDQSGITTITDLTGLSVTVDVEADRLIRITGSATIALTSSGASVGGAIGTVREGSTELGRWGSMIYDHTGANTRAEKHEGSVIVASPSAGSHTYKLSIARAAGASGGVGVDQAADNPAFILVEDIGADPDA